MEENNNNQTLTPAGDTGENFDALPTTADTADAENTVAATGLGKFKSVEALQNAYLSLEAEFTRRSKRLKELEQGNKAQQMPDKGALSPAGEEDILKAALSDESVRAAIIADYLKTLSAGRCAPLISDGVSACAAKTKPATVREAGELADRFFRN